MLPPISGRWGATWSRIDRLHATIKPTTSRGKRLYPNVWEVWRAPVNALVMTLTSLGNVQPLEVRPLSKASKQLMPIIWHARE